MVHLIQPIDDVTGVVTFYREDGVDGAVKLAVRVGETITTIHLPARLLSEGINTVVLNAGQESLLRSIILNHAVESILEQDAGTTLTIYKRCVNRAIKLRQVDSAKLGN